MRTETGEQVATGSEIRTVGLSRSGNHAVLNWMIRQIDGRYCFLNCAEPKFNPFCSARPLNETGQTYRTNIPAFDLEQEKQGRFSPKDYLIYSYEDCFLGMLNHSVFTGNRERWIGRFPVKKDVLILRDAFNLFASRIKSGLIRGHYTHHGTRPISLLTLKRIYKQHAREFLGEKTYLKNSVPVNFNRWSSDREYRQFVAHQLGIAFSDKGFDEVSSVAGGSSFDGVSLSGRAYEMKLQNRWKEFADDGNFWDLFDPELVELNRRIFGEIEPVQYFEERQALSLAH